MTAGKPVNSLVLSGNRRLVLSGNKSSCYQATKSAANPHQHWVSPASNIPNLNSLTFSREVPFRWTTPETQKARRLERRNQPKTKPRSAGQEQPGSPNWRAAP
ncbi:hypothetical protein B5S52_02150 [Pectobacterium brasiliense]|nr:hypothetical protein B5S52_02150 [Pectobacterium brasiliense]